ncbi:MAG: prepilin peptidase [Acidobacteria bacterium]|nr:prepilin peptidase [Acidobacteriota bacterium]
MTAVWWIAGVLGLVASIEDLRRRRIPNWLTGAGVAAGVLCGAAHGWHGLGAALAGAAAGFLLLLPLNLVGALGGGDVKLMAAFGSLLGPSGILAAAVFGAAAGAFWALGAMVRGVRAIPYAPAIVAGVWVSLVGGGS